ncbi:MAG: permease-like cell division protein FtsX [bacterium]
MEEEKETRQNAFSTHIPRKESPKDEIVPHPEAGRAHYPDDSASEQSGNSADNFRSPHSSHDMRGRVQHHSGRKKVRKGYRVVFLITLCGGLLADSVLFMARQLGEVRSLLEDDFKVLVISTGKISKDKAGVMEEKIRALPGVSAVTYIGGDRRLKKLEETDPDLVQSMVLLGSNPMPDTFEVRVEEKVLGDVYSWAETVREVRGVANVRYKPFQAYAILQTIFYERFLKLSLSLAGVFLAFLGIMTLTYRSPWHNLLPELKNNPWWGVSGAAGAFAAVFICFFAVYPIRYLSPLWAWPRLIWHTAIVLAGAFSGWVLFKWKNTQ